MKKFLSIFFILVILTHFIPQINKVHADSFEGISIYPAIDDMNIKPGDEKQVSKFFENKTDVDKQIIIENSALQFSREFRDNPQLDTEIVEDIEINIDNEKITISPNQKYEIKLIIKPKKEIPEGLYAIRTEFKNYSEENNEISINESIMVFTFITVAEDPLSLKSIKIDNFDFGKKYKFDYSFPWKDKAIQIKGNTTVTNNGKTHITPTGYVTVKRNDLKLESTYTLNSKYITLYPQDSISNDIELNISPYRTLRVFDIYSVYSYTYQDSNNPSIYEFREQKIFVINLYNILSYFVTTLFFLLIVDLIIKLTKNKKNTKVVKGKLK
ncbi:MAG TPA: hypothetical protein PK957_02125 [Candidatus Dojkabacteria bacterium]|nr:hypothetical protein [Candidatus Dojkabacteria bacterium]HQF37110.1 hypothetical protein [Candidatus Dojkabacteria bacterium]